MKMMGTIISPWRYDAAARHCTSTAEVASRDRCARSSHHGIEKRAAPDARRRLERKNGGFWRAQLRSEVARPKGFELRRRLAAGTRDKGEAARSEE
jgi:hypothetical protein